MRSAARALAPSHPLHVMPSRITRNSLRPRASDRTMVASEATTSLAALSKLDGSVTISRETHENGQQAKLLQRSETTVGWISRERNLARPRRSFFLDILFIEPIDHEGGPMPQISTQEFERLPLRVHAFLAGVPLHDVWAIDLPRTRSGVTLDEFLRTASSCLLTPSPVVRALLNIRLFVGRLLGWDREPAATAWESFATRMTTADRSRSLAPSGTREGLFRVVYRFENEQLPELINLTAHAAALSALVETANGYRFYFGIYVRSVSRFTPIYMTMIGPFRKLVVYPSLLRTVRAKWNRTFGTA